MKFDVLTLFPEMFKMLDESIIGRAKEKGLINVNLIDIRDFSKDKHRKVDDIYNYGSSDIYVVKNELGKQILLPAIDDVILQVDLENEKIVVHLLKGLVEE